MPAIPRVLSEIAEFLSENEVALDNSAGDARIDSATSEDIIIKKISEKFGVQEPTKETRNWWDFSITDTGVFYPVNIKISKFGSASDNLGGKLGIYYALTGRIPEPNLVKKTGWKEFFRRLSVDMKETDKDYYFLVINKRNASDILVQGLKTIRVLTPNGSNPPFQCCWKNNRQPQSRSFAEARDFLLSNLSRSVKARAQIYPDFLSYFPQYEKDDG